MSEQGVPTLICRAWVKAYDDICRVGESAAPPKAQTHPGWSCSDLALCERPAGLVFAMNVQPRWSLHTRRTLLDSEKLTRFDQLSRAVERRKSSPHNALRTQTEASSPLRCCRPTLSSILYSRTLMVYEILVGFCNTKDTVWVLGLHFSFEIYGQRSTDM